MQNKKVICNKDAKSLVRHLRNCSLCAGLVVELQEAIKTAELMTLDQRKAEAIFQKTRLKARICFSRRRMKIDNKNMDIPFRSSSIVNHCIQYSLAVFSGHTVVIQESKPNVLSIKNYIGGSMKTLFALAFVLAVLVIMVPNSYAGKQDFVLINATGVEINSLFVSPTKSDDWGEDVLGDQTLADGEKATINFTSDQDTCIWDFSVTDPEETSVEWKGIDLCKYEQITLHIKGEKVWATFQ